MRVKSVKKTNKSLAVYDLEVPKYHNFSINGGIIVHNCIDAIRYGIQPVIDKKYRDKNRIKSYREFY